MVRLVNARGIKEYGLQVLFGVNAANLVARCLRFVADYKNLLSQHAVKQRRFTHVWASDNGNEP